MGQGIVYKKIETDEETAGAKELIIKYAQWLNLDLCFQNFDEELGCFPEKYKEPDGAFIIAKENNSIIGCVGIRKIGAQICEMKRLFVNDDYKGKGIGKKLVEEIIEEAKNKKYEKIRLDTIDTMDTALNIYCKNGFYKIEPYYNNPNEGTVYLEKIL